MFPYHLPPHRLKAPKRPSRSFTPCPEAASPSDGKQLSGHPLLTFVESDPTSVLLTSMVPPSAALPADGGDEVKKKLAHIFGDGSLSDIADDEPSTRG